MSRPSVSQLGSSTPLELVRLEDRLVMSGNPIAAQVREMTFETLNTGDFSYAVDMRGDVMVTARRDGKMDVMASDGSGARVLDGPGGLVKEARLSPDGTMVAGVGFGKTVMVKNVETGAVVQQWTFGDYVSGVEWSADGKSLTADVDNSGVRLLTLGSTEMRSMGAGSFEGGVLGDGRMVASKNNGIELEGGVRWNTGRVMIAVNVHGSLVAAGGLDGLLGVWDTETNGKVYLGGHSGAVTSCRFSPDGRYVASTDTNGLVLVHDVATGEIVTSETGAGAISAVFSSNQKDVVYVRNGGSSGTVIDRIAMPEGMWIVPEVEEESSEGLEAVSTEASDAVFAAMAEEEVDILDSLSAYAAGKVVEAREKVAACEAVMHEKQSTKDTLQAAYDSAYAVQMERKDAYVAAGEAVIAAGVTRKDAENAFWVIYGQYKYSDAGKIAQAQNTLNAAVAAEQAAVTKKASAGTVYTAAQVATAAAEEVLGVAQAELTEAQRALEAEEDVCAGVEAQAVAGELIEPTEQELWIAACQEEARGKLTEYGFAKWEETFAANGYEEAPAVWCYVSIGFHQTLLQLPESLWEGTGCKVDITALALSIAKGHDGWLYGDTLNQTWEMVDSLAAAYGMSASAIRYMQQEGLTSATTEAYALVHAFQEMTQDLFFVELSKRTGCPMPTVREVSHPLLPTRAAMTACVNAEFGRIFAQYMYMVDQGVDGQHVVDGASNKAAPKPKDDRTPEQKRDDLLAAQAKYLVSSGQAKDLVAAKTLAETLYSSSGTLTAEAQQSSVTVVASADMSSAYRKQMETILTTEGTGTVSERLAAYVKAFPKALPVLVAMQGESQYVALNDVITGVRLVAEAGVSDGAQEHHQFNLVEMGGSDAIPAAAQEAANIVSSIAQRQLYIDALGWYDASTSALHSIFMPRTDTITGKIMAGAAERLWQSQTPYALWFTAVTLESLTDIPAYKIVATREDAVDASAFAERFTNLLVTAQYGELFAPSDGRYAPRFVAAHPDRDAAHPYTEGSVRIRFDLVAREHDVRRVELLLNGQVLTMTAATTFIEVPVSTIGMSGTGIQLTLRGHLSDGSAIEMLVDPIAVAPTKVSAEGFSGAVWELSTLREGHENRDEENIVLSALQESNHLYFDDISQWTWSMASTAHDNDALNAIDFIRSNADNASVRSPYAGKVVFNEKDSSGNSTLVVEHQTNHEGRTIYWYTKYLHMHTNADDLVYMVNGQGEQIVLTPGTNVAAGAVIGLVGSEGKSTGPHLHQELLIAPNGRQIVQQHVGEKSAEFFTTDAVDQRLLLTTGTRAIHVVATAISGDMADSGNGRVSVQWNTTIGAWVDAINNVVYDRREQQDVTTGNGTHWLAYEAGKALAEMERLVWKAVRYEGEAVPQERWVMASDETQEWNPQEQRFISKKKA